MTTTSPRLTRVSQARPRRCGRLRRAHHHRQRGLRGPRLRRQPEPGLRQARRHDVRHRLRRRDHRDLRQRHDLRPRRRRRGDVRHRRRHGVRRLRGRRDLHRQWHGPGPRRGGRRLRHGRHRERPGQRGRGRRRPARRGGQRHPDQPTPARTCPTARTRLYGGDGNDYLNGYEGIDWVEGQAGDDSLESHEVAPAYDHLVGGQGKDRFAVKDAVEHDSAHRDDVDVDNFDVAVTNKNAADTFH
ncbi:calcium-binding protein [Nocardioides convexus]|uniref:calcium-binding protein n=1 Tax=Nocardioides convexus TaxID=2712224 RepID=UPI002418AAE0|nr:calcium-binding protein [Nocardioides convexus]